MQIIRNLWWTKWYCSRIFSQQCSFPCKFHCSLIHTQFIYHRCYIISGNDSVISCTSLSFSLARALLIFLQSGCGRFNVELAIKLWQDCRIQTDAFNACSCFSKYSDAKAVIVYPIRSQTTKDVCSKPQFFGRDVLQISVRIYIEKYMKRESDSGVTLNTHIHMVPSQE